MNVFGLKARVTDPHPAYYVTAIVVLIILTILSVLYFICFIAGLILLATQESIYEGVLGFTFSTIWVCATIFIVHILGTGTMKLLYPV